MAIAPWYTTGKKSSRGGILGYNFLLGVSLSCLSGWCWLIEVQFGVVSNKCRKLYGEETTQAGGVSGVLFFFTRLGGYY